MTQNGWKILVVDDDSGLRELVVNLLVEEGYTVATAENGSDLPAALRNADFDLIILDIMLPGQSGLDLCVYLRQTSTVLIMILTARMTCFRRSGLSELGIFSQCVLAVAAHVERPADVAVVSARFIGCHVTKAYG
jgi:two-component system phosphate regulon response regulator OmpR